MSVNISSEQKKYMMHLTMVLFTISAVTALLLGFVNAITKDRIAEIAYAETQSAMRSIIPGADTFTDLNYEGPEDVTVLGAYSSGELIGYCVQAAPNGFGGAISMVVGVNLDGTVAGVTITGSSETAGVGTKTESQDFLGQYIGRSGTITVNTGDNSISAITGATVSSAAVTKGVNTALSVIASLS